MKIIQEDNFADIMKDEVEPYLYAHCRECYITGAKEPERREKNGKLHVKFYETDRPKGVIIISHGFTEGAQKYDEMIYYFLKVCHVVKEQYSELPLFLFAHSMGGAIGTIAAAWETELFQKIILSSPMIRPLTGNVPWSVTVAIAQVECLAGRNARYVIGQKPYDGSEILETSAAVSEARFTRYNEIRKQSREIQTSAASYGWLLASIKMSWYLRYHGWKKLTAPVLLFQAEKDAFVSVRAIQKFAKKLQRKGRTSCEYMYMPGSKHEIFGSDDETMQAYVERILSFLE